MSKLSKRMKRMLAIVLVEMVVASKVLISFAFSESEPMSYSQEEVEGWVKDEGVTAAVPVEEADIYENNDMLYADAGSDDAKENDEVENANGGNIEESAAADENNTVDNDAEVEDSIADASEVSEDNIEANTGDEDGEAEENVNADEFDADENTDGSGSSIEDDSAKGNNSVAERDGGDGNGDEGNAAEDINLDNENDAEVAALTDDIGKVNSQNAGEKDAEADAVITAQVPTMLMDLDPEESEITTEAEVASWSEPDVEAAAVTYSVGQNTVLAAMETGEETDFTMQDYINAARTVVAINEATNEISQNVVAANGETLTDEETAAVKELLKSISKTDNFVVYTDSYSSYTHIDGNIAVNTYTSDYLETIKGTEDNYSYIGSTTENGLTIGTYDNLSTATGVATIVIGEDSNVSISNNNANATIVELDSMDDLEDELKITENLDRIAQQGEAVKEILDSVSGENEELTGTQAVNAATGLIENEIADSDTIIVLEADISAMTSSDNSFAGAIENLVKANAGVGATIVINVVIPKDSDGQDVSSITLCSPINSNAYAEETAYVVWNFGNYSGTIQNSQVFTGIVVAPNATVEQYGVINGRVIANELRQTMEIHTPDSNKTQDPAETPDASASPDPKASASTTPSASVSPDPKASASATPSASVSPDPKASASTTPSASVSPDPKASASATPSASVSPDPKASATPSASVSPDPKASASVSPDPNASATPSASVSPDPNASATPKAGVSPTPGASDSSTPGVTPGANETPNADQTPDPNETPNPDVTPVPGNTPAPGNDNDTPAPGGGDPNDDGSIDETFSDPLDMQNAPSTPQGQVLGAKRVNNGNAVLGARRGSDYAVLGKRRRPATGDSMALIIWMLVLAAAAGGAITSLIMLHHNNKHGIKR